MRRYNYNTTCSTTQDRIPIFFFIVVGIVLLHHCVALLIEFKSIQIPEVNAWTTNYIISQRRYTSGPFKPTNRSLPHYAPIRKSHRNTGNNDIREIRENRILNHDALTKLQRTTSSIAIGMAIFASTLSTVPSNVNAYDNYISEPVQVAIKAVQDANTNDALVKAYENIAEIITEGKGIGGSINFQGVQLDRGYVSDEDTSIYNPGLTLLTETEKTRLVDTVVESKKRQLTKSSTTSTDSTGSWNGDLEAGYSFLRDRLDPLHMYELRGYLSILPIYGAIMYLVALAVQQLARDVFPIAYIICASAVFVPIIVLVLFGPQ